MPNDDLVESVLKHSDILAVVSSYLPVVKKGKSHVCLCPFHDDKHPSMQISQEKQIFKCFVCGEGGNAIRFVQRFEKVSFRQAMLKVAEISGYDDPRLKANNVVKVEDESVSRVYKVLEDAQTYYRYSLSIPEGEKARAYLESRGLDAEIQEKYGIGYSPKDASKTKALLQAKKHSLKAIEESGIVVENGNDRFNGRITFALFSPDGKINGFSARRFEEGQGGGKYVNSPEAKVFHKGDNLYNYHNALPASRVSGCCYLLEGFMDVIALHKAGIDYAIASMGTKLTDTQVNLLKRLKCEIRLCLDGDDPGQEATLKIGTQLNKAGVPYSIVDYQGDKRDPDEILNQEGKEALIARLERKITAFEFALNFYGAKAGDMDVGSRKKLVERFLPYLRQTPPGIQYEDLLNRISDATGFHKEAIREMALSEVKDDLPEEATYVRGAIKPKGIRGNKELNALMLAEKTFMHYMLTSPEALQYYKDHAIRFRGNSTYEAIANYILEYEQSHPGNLNVSLLQGYIDEASDGKAQEVVNELSELVLEETVYPPLSEGELGRIEATMAEQTAQIQSKAMVRNAMANGSKTEAAKSIKEYVEARRKKRQSTKKGA